MDTMLLATRVPFKTGSPGAYDLVHRAEMCQEKPGIEAERAKTNTPAQRLSWGVVWGEPGDDLLSHGNPHYHRRGVVSRSCSGWEGVVPTRYGHQAMTCCHVDGVNATNMGM